MLRALAIRDVVLIERLDIDFQGGLSALTGETGAGKSILLDSLALALGARSESSLVRPGAQQASVAAVFDLPKGHIAAELLAEQGLDGGESQLVLRRIVDAKGGSRAFVNDQPASIGLMRRLGDALVEIHGQFESHSLLNPATHRAVLDAFGHHEALLSQVRDRYALWRSAEVARRQAEADLEKSRAEEAELRFAVDELRLLAPEQGEDVRLAEKRALMMHAEKLAEGINGALAALTRPASVETALSTAQRQLERVAEKAGGKLAPAIQALERAAIEAGEALSQIEQIQNDIDLDPAHLEKIEERLFTLKQTARKHGVEVDQLADLAGRLEARLADLDGGGKGLARLARAEAEAKEAYATCARQLSESRKAAAGKLDVAVASELAPLKLEKARFETQLQPLEEAEWGETGLERVAFQVATNPGTAPGPLNKIASGGELARFMLALKVVLAGTSPVACLVFDEVDSGIGGAVAAAVGERLKRLAAVLQVLVVTHSPQVAALADHHYKVSKAEAKGSMTTKIDLLEPESRIEEVARMLSGAEITSEARQAAWRLMGRA
ncbi:MAG: DNA repair protein RecN [Alphaproteobacteria bacterium]|nr:DNA repair protein RecN [Alphaproteobacteria bacterium]